MHNSIQFRYFLLLCISLLVHLAILLIILYFYKSYRIGKKIQKMTYILSKTTSEDSVESYILFLESTEVYPREKQWNLIKSAYVLAQESDEIGNDTKNRLRKTIPGKGIII